MEKLSRSTHDKTYPPRLGTDYASNTYSCWKYILYDASIVFIVDFPSLFSILPSTNAVQIIRQKPPSNRGFLFFRFRGTIIKYSFYQRTRSLP